MCRVRKRATSAPAEGPVYGLDFARHCELSLRALQAQKWRLHASRTFGATWHNQISDDRQSCPRMRVVVLRTRASLPAPGRARLEPLMDRTEGVIVKGGEGKSGLMAKSVKSITLHYISNKQSLVASEIACSCPGPRSP